MVKENILAWLLVVVYLLLAALLAITFKWFGSTQFLVCSLSLMLVGCVGTALSLACHDGIKSSRLVFYLVVSAGGALFTALPYV